MPEHSDSGHGWGEETRSATPYSTNEIEARLSAIRNSLPTGQRLLSVEEALQQAGQLQLLLASVDMDHIDVNWRIGIVLAHTELSEDSRRATIDVIVRRLWTDHRIHADRAHLVDCIKLYEVFEGDYERFRTWIDEKTRLLHRPVSWDDLRADCFDSRCTPAGIAEESGTDVSDGDREAGTRRGVSGRAEAHDEDAGAAIEMVRIEGESPVAECGPVPRCPEYLRFVRRFACVVCGGAAVAHHVPGIHPAAVEPTDFGTVPLCRRHLQAFDRIGRPEFERTYDLSLVEVAFNLLHKYLTDEWVTMRLQER